MKNKFILFEIFFLSFIVGITFVILLNSPIQGNKNSFISRSIADQINNEKSILHNNDKIINSLKKEFKKLEKSFNIESKVLNDYELDEYNNLKLLSGQKTVKGEGIQIIISPNENNNDNLAFIFDSDRVLLKLINKSKLFGSEIIAINNHIIKSDTGIVLAGNHINIDNIPITIPYEIKIIGNEKTLYRNFTKDSTFLLELEDKYNLDIIVTKSRNLTISSSYNVKELEYISEYELK